MPGDEYINFTKMEFYNKRGSRAHKKKQFRKWERPAEFEDIPIHKYGTRSTGIRHDGFWEAVPEMIPELIVPDLSDTNLKPYVSYATKDIYQEELNSKDLFNVIYGRKIVEDFKAGKLDKDGNSLEPNGLEMLRPDQALQLARQTGSDIFLGGELPDKSWTLDYKVGKK